MQSRDLKDEEWMKNKKGKGKFKKIFFSLCIFASSLPPLDLNIMIILDYKLLPFFGPCKIPTTSRPMANAVSTLKLSCLRRL